MNQDSIDRRKFLQISTIAAITGVPSISCNRSTSLWRFFTQEEALLMESIADQIIPPDQDPGGEWAGVVRFIDRQLVKYYSVHQERYRRGLMALEETSLAVNGKRFRELSFTGQNTLLGSVENDQVPKEFWSHESASSFFDLILDHCMKGFYGTPRHGGNRDFVSYRMVGLNHPQVLGRVKMGVRS